MKNEVYWDDHRIGEVLKKDSPYTNTFGKDSQKPAPIIILSLHGEKGERRTTHYEITLPILPLLKLSTMRSPQPVNTCPAN